MIQYVGWADQLISPGNSLHYYETVHRFMTENTEMDIDDFYRLFTVGGMQHWYVVSSCSPIHLNRLFCSVVRVYVHLV